MAAPSLSLTDRLALVTGSSRGLGAATAVRLAELGADVFVTYRQRAAEAEAVAARVRAAGQRAWVRPLDLEDEASIDACFDAVVEEAGRLDVLVANAASTTFRPLLKADRRHVERTFAISVLGFHQCVRRAADLMGDGGRVVAVSGADTSTWIPGHGILAAAKAAMEMLVRYYAQELGRRGVTIVGVSPGWLDGDSIQAMLGPLYEFGMQLERETHPMKAAMTPDDVADTVALLCTDAARLMSGDTVMADGGGVFAFCGRYSKVGARLALAELAAAQAGGAGEASELTGAIVDAPAVPD